MKPTFPRLWLIGLSVLGVLSGSNAWYKSNFSINSKLPKECGRLKTYSPELQLQVWGAWPWLGLIQYDGYGYERCNAILIHPQVALSTVYCVKHIPEVVLEEHLFIAFSTPALPTFQNVSVTNINFVGDSYNTWRSISLLRLSKPVVISSDVQPICLWEAQQDWSTQIANHVGLFIGTDHDNLYIIERLRIYQAPVQIMSMEKCSSQLEERLREHVFGTQLCFKYLRDPKICHSIGSAMMMPRLADDGTIVWYVRALLSQRMWFCDNDTPLRAFDIGKQKNWIESHFKSSVEAGCGRRVLAHTPLITRGTEALRGDWPWHAAIYVKSTDGQRPSSYQCGGSLISRNFVLTAAHCVGRAPNPERFEIKLGKHNRIEFEPGQQDMTVSQVIVHEGMNWTTLRNDVALLKLCQDVVYSDYIQPICLWDETDTNKQAIYNRVGNVVGWGFTENDTLSNNLTIANVPITEDLICIQSNANFYSTFLHDNTFCAGNPNGNGSGVCNGDSGGGLALPVTQDDHEITWFLRGIVSVSVKRTDANLCDPKYYTIYTDVAKYTGWVLNKINAKDPEN